MPHTEKREGGTSFGSARASRCWASSWRWTIVVTLSSTGCWCSSLYVPSLVIHPHNSLTFCIGLHRPTFSLDFTRQSKMEIRGFRPSLISALLLDVRLCPSRPVPSCSRTHILRSSGRCLGMGEIRAAGFYGICHPGDFTQEIQARRSRGSSLDLL